MASLDADVVVIGAGPAGLAAAIAIRTALPGISVLVFDKATSFRPAGSFVSISLNGRSALNALSPAALASIEAHSVLTKEMLMVDDQGGLQKKIPYASNPVFWYWVQRCLYEQLPAEIVHAKHSFESLQQLPNDAGYEVTFDNGTTASCPYLVGADAARSLVRTHILNDAPAEYNGSITCRGHLPMPPWWPHVRDIINYDRQLMMMPMGDGLLGWTTMELMAEAPSRGACRDAAGVKARLVAAFAAFEELALRIVVETAEEHIMQHANYAREHMGDLLRWGRGAATLVGDAAHVMSNNGQGTSMALEDALELGRSLAEHGLSQQALRAYEDARSPRIRALATMTYEQVQQRRRGFAASPAADARMKEMQKVGQSISQAKFEPIRPRRPPAAVAAGGTRCAGCSSAVSQPRALGV